MSFLRVSHIRPLLLVLLLAGCAASPLHSTLYLLPGDSSPAASRAAARDHTLIVRPLQIADFLNVDGIVLQLDDITLNQATAHRWAEQPALQLQRGLRQRLANRLPDTEVLDANARTSDAMQLQVELDTFQGTHNGAAIAAGQWQLRSANGAIVVQRNFRAVTVLESDGYPTLVRALGRSWDAVADEIVAGIAALR
jgi:hypothetical protein